MLDNFIGEIKSPGLGFDINTNEDWKNIIKLNKIHESTT